MTAPIRPDEPRAFLIGFESGDADRALSQEHQASHLGQSNPYSCDTRIMRPPEFPLNRQIGGDSSTHGDRRPVRAPFGLAAGPIMIIGTLGAMLRSEPDMKGRS